MSNLKAKLTFVTGMGSDAALIAIDSNCQDMVTSDIYDCGVYDWIAYNLDIEIPECSVLSFSVDVFPSCWGNEIEEIDYTLNGKVEVSKPKCSCVIMGGKVFDVEVIGPNPHIKGGFYVRFEDGGTDTFREKDILELANVSVGFRTDSNKDSL
ncbi:hypothetical protein [Vibrio phage vB_VpM-pA2SJ1]|uniref:Uncharacterized protein n=1 Tax=Vibrio phage vB_VpM-pA2SJ1 TaxID=3095964 RepID=A0AAX4J579_9CAUD